MRIVPRHQRIEQRARDLAKVVAIIDATEDSTPLAATQLTRNLQGDARVMRMIPICAQGVPGTAPDTDPYDMLDDNWPLASIR